MRLTLSIIVFVAISCAAQTRPAILGVSHIAVYSSDAAQAEQFYVHDLGLKKGSDPENAHGVRYYVNQEQFVEVLPLPAGAGADRLNHLAWITANADALRLYFGAHGVAVPETVQHGSDGSAWFDVRDPEGNTVQLVQPPARWLRVKNTAQLYSLAGADPIGRRIIHVGMVVHNRAKEDAFYCALLGFRPYWYGGMHPGRLQWVSQQVPDGHDWLEYMLTETGAQLSQKQFGVLNHFSLGVVNMEQAVTTLYSQDRLAGEPPRPQMGMDGKWQFNFYDPDRTRVELMEFSPAAKPCCSEFTAASPSPAGQP